MNIDGEIITINDWVIRFRAPDGSGQFPVFLLLHGWTGDENSMWVFTPRLPKEVLLIAPRGIYKAETAGYSWYPKQTKPLPWADDFKAAVETILNQITNQNFPAGDFSRLHLIGFSQGAALAYTLAAMHPEKVTSLGGLSGFLPDGAGNYLTPGKLGGLPIFVAHGTEDNLVPVERARLSVGELEKAGGAVTYCEDNVGHKLSAKCFHGLEAFYKKVNC